MVNITDSKVSSPLKRECQTCVVSLLYSKTTKVGDNLSTLIPIKTISLFCFTDIIASIGINLYTFTEI